MPVMDSGADSWAISVAELTAPCLRLDVDVAAGLPEVPPGPQRSAWILVRFHSEPVGKLTLRVPSSGLTSLDIQVEIDRQLGARVRERASACGTRWPSPRPDLPLPCSRTPPYLESRTLLLDHAPRITVVVCSRDRASALRRCLASLTRQAYPRYSVLVVDSASRSSATREVVCEFEDDPLSIRYVREPRPGLSRARNLGLRLCTDDYLAWIDDDEVADPAWLAELARALMSGPRVAAASGLMVPAQLSTWAEVRFEQYGGHSKHRGFDPVTFDPVQGMRQSPFYPLPAFATGGNVAIRCDVLRELGGLDESLGAGTFTLGGADTRLFTEILCSGRSIVYQPSALTHHFHRQTIQALRRLMYAYGSGLSAYYASMLTTNPSRIGPLLRLVPDVLSDAFGRSSRRSGDLPMRFPPSLRWANRLGLLSGPPRYLAARLLERGSTPSMHFDLTAPRELP